MTSIPLPSDPILSWAAYYWSQWFIEFMALQIASYGILIFFLRRFYKENLGEKVGDMLWVLGGLGLKTQNPDMGEAQFEKSAVDSMISNLLNARSQKEGLTVFAKSLGDGLPRVSPTGLNRMSSDQRESLSELHNVEQCISISEEKTP